MNAAWSVSEGRWLFLLLLSVQCTPCQAFNLANLKALATDVFTGYQKELRPVEDSSQPLNITAFLWLTSLQNLDEISQRLIFSSILRFVWIDRSLAWDPSNYNQTEYLSYPQQDMWIPDITIQNSVETMQELGFDRNYMYIRYDGYIIWIMSGVFVTSCAIDITYYPFDTQRCSIVLTTLVSLKYEIDLQTDAPDAVSLDLYSESGSWDLVSLEPTSIEDTSRQSRVAFTITMQRLSLYYVVTILIPVVFLSLTATLVFALPADSGEKMGTSITVLLAFAVYLTIVSDQMPKTSTQVSILAVYLTMLLGLTSMGVLLTVWILNLHFRDDKHPPGRRLRAIVHFLERIVWKGSKVGTVTPEDDQKEITDMEKTAIPRDDKQPPSPSSYDVEEVTWRHVAYIFDRALFYFFTALLCLVTIICLSILIFG